MWPYTVRYTSFWSIRKWQIRRDIFKKVGKSDFFSSEVTMKFGKSGSPTSAFVPIVTGLRPCQDTDMDIPTGYGVLHNPDHAWFDCSHHVISMLTAYSVSNHRTIHHDSIFLCSMIPQRPATVHADCTCVRFCPILLKTCQSTWGRT